jgi:hypothetical protein
VRVLKSEKFNIRFGAFFSKSSEQNLIFLFFFHSVLQRRKKIDLRNFLKIVFVVLLLLQISDNNEKCNKQINGQFFNVFIFVKIKKKNRKLKQQNNALK